MEIKIFKLLLQVITLLAFSDTISQVAPSRYLIYFTDKDQSSFSTSHPSAFLSQRAIDRRTKQNIQVTEQDLPVNENYVSAVRYTGVTVLNRSKWMNAVTIYTADTSVLSQIRGLSFVKGIKFIAKLPRVEEGDKWKWMSSTDARNIHFPSLSPEGLAYGAAYNQVNMIAADYLHQQGFKGENMVIAVLDAGFFKVDALPAFDSIRFNNQILGTWDFVDNEVSVYEDNAHGMMVLSTMAANLPGEIIGTAPKANYWLLKTEDVNSEYRIEEFNWVAAAEFADSVGADVINSSLGYTQFDDPAQNYSYTDMDGNTAISTIGADIAASKGILVVNSAGNSGNSSWKYIGAPADGDSVFSIGAVNPFGEYVSFSSIGPTVDGRIKPNVVAQGAATAIISTNGGVTASNGTSFSSPIIAGASACLWQAFPELNHVQLMEAIQKSASQFETPDQLVGYGIPNYSLAYLNLKEIDATMALKDSTIITVYPNPFSENLNVMFYSVDSGSVFVTLHDILGKQVSSDTYSTISNSYSCYEVIVPGNLNAGLYFLSINANTRRVLKKVVKY